MRAEAACMLPRPARHRRSALSVLVAGIALAAGLATVEASASDDAHRRADRSLGSDLVVTGPLDAATVERLQLLRPVDLMAAGVTGSARVGRTVTKVVAWDDDGAAGLLLSRTADAGVVDHVGAGQLVLDRHTADDLGLAVGDRVPVSTAVGSRELLVTGISADSGLGGGATVSWSDAPALFGDARPGVAHVKLAAATPVAGVRDEVAGIVGAGATVRTRAEVVAAAEPTGVAPPPAAAVLALLAAVLLAGALLARPVAGQAGQPAGGQEGGRSAGSVEPVSDGAAAAKAEGMVGTARRGAADAGGAALLGAAVGAGAGAAVVSLLDLGTVLPWARLAAFVVTGAVAGVAATMIRSRSRGRSRGRSRSRSPSPSRADATGTRPDARDPHGPG